MLDPERIIQVLPIGVHQQLEVRFQGQQLIQGTDQKVARAHRGVQHGKPIKPQAIFRPPLFLEAVAQVFPGSAAGELGEFSGPFPLREPPHHCAAQGVPGHVHGHKAGCVEGTVPVSIDFLKDQPQHCR